MNSCKRALAPWQAAHAGDLLAGIEAAETPELADWLDAQRRALAVRRVAACRTAWQAAMDAGRWQAALDAGGALPDEAEINRARKPIMLGTHLVALIPLPAVFLARGWW